MFYGNFFSSFLGAMSLSLLSFFGAYDQINYINYVFNLAATIFTFIDFGRSNAILLNKQTSSDTQNDLQFSIVQIIIILALVSLIDVLGLFNLSFFDLTFIVCLFLVQRTYYSNCIANEQDYKGVSSQIYLSIIKLVAILGIVTIPTLSTKIIISFLYGTCLLVVTLLFLIKTTQNNGFSIKETTKRITTLLKHMKIIGPNNIFLILIDRFEILFFIYLIGDIEYASFITLISYSYLIGILVDAVMKKLYLKDGLSTRSYKNNMIIFLKKHKLKISAVFVLIIISMSFFTNKVFNHKFVLVEQIIVYAVFFQSLRFVSQYVELDFIRTASSKLLVLRTINVILFIIGFVVCLQMEVHLTHLLIIFSALRLLNITLLFILNKRENAFI